jgi:hypothetical protein
MHLAQWSIGLYSGNSPSELRPIAGINNPVIRAEDVTDVPARFVADPFWVREGSQWHMFFEVWNGKTRRGDIGLASSADGLKWCYERIVLQEKFHLSYPYVFKAQGRYYMVPETRQMQSVRLYEASPFPFEFSYVSTLLNGNFADPSIVFFNDTWWLFVLEGTESLELYFADDLKGPWTRHPQSPLIRNDKRRARPGGRIITHQGGLIRYAQNCEPVYGHQLRVFAIEILTRSEYREVEYASSPLLSPTSEPWCNHAMHHADPLEVSPGLWLACVDGATIVPAIDADIPSPPG